MKEDEVNDSRYKSGRKSRNKIVKILTKLKSRNFYKFKFQSLSKTKKVQQVSIIEESNFWISDTIVAFTKLR